MLPVPAPTVQYPYRYCTSKALYGAVRASYCTCILLYVYIAVLYVHSALSAPSPFITAEVHIPFFSNDVPNWTYQHMLGKSHLIDVSRLIEVVSAIESTYVRTEPVTREFHAHTVSACVSITTHPCPFPYWYASLPSQIMTACLTVFVFHLMQLSLLKRGAYSKVICCVTPILIFADPTSQRVSFESRGGHATGRKHAWLTDRFANRKIRIERRTDTHTNAQPLLSHRNSYFLATILT